MIGKALCYLVDWLFPTKAITVDTSISKPSGGPVSYDPIASIAMLISDERYGEAYIQLCRGRKCNIEDRDFLIALVENGELKKDDLYMGIA